jgi:hypothetical protein
LPNPGAVDATRGLGASHVKRIGFLSFGHWQRAQWSKTSSAAEALRQTIELAEAAEELGLDGAFVRVHHFARQLASPFPLLAAIGARTSPIEFGTGVIDMRYENPCTWRKRQRPPTSSAAAGYSWASVAAPRNRGSVPLKRIADSADVESQ